MRSAQERFDEKYIPITESGCWIFIGSLDSDGYGRFEYRVNSHVIRKAHRASYILHYNEDIGGKNICHKCDTPSCVNPNHLFIADQEANIADRQRKNRQAKGEKINSNKLTEAEAIEIKYTDLNHRNIHELSEIYEVSVSTIYDIIHERTWKHI